MPDGATTESIDLPHPESLKAFEGNTYYGLPEEVNIGDKGLLVGLRDLRQRTKDSNTEWSGYMTKNALGNLGITHIKPGEEDQAAVVDVLDLTGLSRIISDKAERDQYINKVIDSESWRSGVKDSSPKVIFGRDLDPIPPERLNTGVEVMPNQEFAGLVHTHRGKDMHSPQDGSMVSEQQFRPDGRPQIPISIVVGPEDIYAIVVPTDANVQNTYGIPSPRGLRDAFKLMDDMRGLSKKDINQKLDEHIQNLCVNRRFGFYRGDLQDGILRRVEFGIGKKLREAGFSQAEITKLEFNTAIPDPDLQIAAILSMKKSPLHDTPTPDEARLLAQDFITFFQDRLPNGQRLKIEPSSNSRFWVIPENGTPLDLAEVRILSGSIDIIFHRSAFYGNQENQRAQEIMISGLDDYYTQRLSDRIPLATSITGAV